MKNFLIALSIITFSTEAFAGVCPRITNINEELNTDFWKNSKVKVLAEIPHSSPTKEFQDFDVLKDLGQEARCQKSMVKTIFTVTGTPGHVFEAITSNEDECDGGNAYGLIKDLADEKVIATIEDSYINCTK